MLFLHDANLRDLTWNGEPLFEASRAEVKEVLNGTCQLKVIYPMTDSKLFEQLVVDKLISAPSPTLGRQFFRVKSITEEDDALELICDPISDDIMKRRIKPMVVNGTDCQTALNRMVASSRTQLGDFLFESDITSPHVFTSEEEETLYTVLMDGQHSILGTWEGELVRDNRLITIKQHRGEDRGEVLSTHHNISSYQRELDASAVYTRVIVHSTFKPEGEKEDRHFEVTIDSPLINSYPYINEVVFENNQLTDIESMKTWAKAKFTHDGIDKVKDSLTIKAYQVDGTTLHLGDTVSIKSKLHKADFKKKVVGYTWDALSESYIDFTFDDQVVYGGASQSPMNNLASEILHANDRGLAAIQAEIDASNQRFDLKEEKLREEIASGISKAEAKAEEQVAKVNQTISVLQEQAKQLTEQNNHQDSVLTSHLSQLKETTDLAKVAKQEALTALAKALAYRNEAIAEASRLDGVDRQAISRQLTTALEVVNHAIQTKVSQTDFDVASKRLSIAETTITQQAEEISKRLTSTQVENAITSKGYQTKAQADSNITNRNLVTTTVLDNRVTETVKGYTREIRRVEAAIPSIKGLATQTQVQSVSSTVAEHNRTFTQLGTLPESVKWSTIKQTIDKVTTTIGNSTAISKTVQTALVNLQVFKDLQTGLSSQQSLTANHYALKFLKATGDVLTQLNLNSGGVKIQGKLIHLNGQTLIDNGVITSAKIASLDAGKITTGYLSANRIAAQAITGDKIKFDQAFFNKMTANEALFKTIFAKNAFITAVQSVTLSANRIVGGLLSATNKAMSINLNQANITFNSSATIDFNSSANALKRKVGDVTGFLHFSNATAGGTYVGLGVTSHNEGVNSQNTGRFAGVRVFRSNDKVDQTEIYGDTIYLGHAFNGFGLKLTATRLDHSYELVDMISSIKALWRCWLHFNNVRWNPSDNNFGRAVINEYNAHNIG